MPLIGSGLLKRSSVTYLLRDEFTTQAAAPLGSPRTTEPGPGAFTLTQTDGQFSIDSSGRLVFPAQGSPVIGDQGFISTTSFGRATGRALLYKVNASTWSTCYLPFLNSAQNITFGAGSPAALYTTATALRLRINASVYSFDVGAISTATDYQVAIVQRAAGEFYFVKGGAFADWTLLFADAATSFSSFYVGFSNHSAAGALEYVRLRDLPGAFAVENGIAALNQATPVSGTDYAAPGSADGLFDLTVTAPNPLGTSHAELRYRVDAGNNDYWSASFNSAGDFLLDSVDNGVATNRLTVAGVIAAGQTQTIRVVAAGTKHNCYTLNGSTWTKRGAEVNLTLGNEAQTTLRPVYVNGYSAASLVAYPRTSGTYAGLG